MGNCVVWICLQKGKKLEVWPLNKELGWVGARSFSKKPQGANNSWMMARQHTSASVTSVFGFSVITDQNITIFWLMYNMLSNKKCLALSIDVQHVDAFNNYRALTCSIGEKKLFINSLNGKLFAFDVKPCSNHSKQKVWLGVMKWNINCSNWE